MAETTATHAHQAVHPGGRIFERIVLAAILANTAVLVISFIDSTHEELWEPVHTAFLLFFVAEIGVRLADVGFNFRRFVSESKWNGFDAIVIAMSLLPLLGVDAQLLRLARLARVVHTLRHATHLRLLVRMRYLFRNIKA